MTPIITYSKEIDDISVYFEIYADGANADKIKEGFVDGAFIDKLENPLILLHGNGESGQIFKSILPKLSKNFCCIVPDTRGHGKTTVGESAFTYDLFAEDLSKLCDELNLGKLNILGFSDGGNTALTYAVRHPERLDTLITSGANIFPTGIKPCFLFATKLTSILNKRASYKNSEAFLKHELNYLMANYPHINPRLLNNISCPALIMEAERELIRPSHTKLIADSIPNSNHVVIKNSTHDVFNTNTQATAKAILSFLLQHNG